MKLNAIATGLVAVAVLAAPSAALAHSDSSVTSVRAHVRSADAALTKVESLVAHNEDAAAAIAMVKNLRQTKAAAREAAKVRGRSNQAKAWRMVARQRNANVESLAELVDEVSGAAQVEMATGLVSNLTGRELALAKLTKLAGMLPAAAQTGIAKAIVAISGHGEDEVADIVGALRSGQIGAAAQPKLGQALTLATTAMFTGVSQLQQIVGMLPPQAQGPVNSAIAHVTSILQGIFGGAGQSGGGTLGNLPIPSNLPVPCGLPIPGFLPFAQSC